MYQEIKKKRLVLKPKVKIILAIILSLFIIIYLLITINKLDNKAINQCINSGKERNFCINELTK